MKLLNFTISPDEPTMTLRGAGYDWDLHNFATLRVVRVAEGVAELVWEPDEDVRAQHGRASPWGDSRNVATQCRLVFHGITLFRDTGHQSKDDQVLDLVQLIAAAPGDTQCQSIVLEMVGGRTIEIAAATAELLDHPPDAA